MLKVDVFCGIIQGILHMANLTNENIINSGFPKFCKLQVYGTPMASTMTTIQGNMIWYMESLNRLKSMCSHPNMVIDYNQTSTISGSTINSAL